MLLDMDGQTNLSQISEHNSWKQKVTPLIYLNKFAI